MTKIINFTAKEVLPALLDYTKVSTWRQYKEGKLARYKPGEKVQLIWGSRWQQKNNSYCAKCFQGDPITMFPNDGCMNCGVSCKSEFSKHLGMAVIDSCRLFIITTKEEGYNILDKNFIILDIVRQERYAKEDGFTSLDEFFKYFSKGRDLRFPVRFWRYEFHWVGKRKVIL